MAYTQVKQHAHDLLDRMAPVSAPQSSASWKPWLTKTSIRQGSDSELVITVSAFTTWEPPSASSR